MSRSLLRSVLELRTPVTRLPPSFLLPMQSRYSFSTSTLRQQDVTTQAATSPQTIPPPSESSTSASSILESSPAASSPPAPLYPKQTQQARAEPLTPEAAESISQLLPLLRAQPNHYIRAHIWGRPYLVTAGDSVRLPFRMAGVLPGDVLRLDRASALGSRDYTLRGDPYVDERLFECRAVVLGVEAEPLRTKEKTKRRQRRTQTVKSKHKYTVLRVSELVVKGPEAVGL